jgi:hypothetical protein
MLARKSAKSPSHSSKQIGPPRRGQHKPSNRLASMFGPKRDALPTSPLKCHLGWRFAGIVVITSLEIGKPCVHHVGGGGGGRCGHRVGFLFISSVVRSGRGLKTVLICSDATSRSASVAGWPMPSMALRYWHNTPRYAACTKFRQSRSSARPRHSECCLLVLVCARFCAHVQRCRVFTRRCPRGWRCTTFE